jgi:CBS domain-containing protein
MSVTELLTEARTFSPTDRASTLIGYLKEGSAYDAFVEQAEETYMVTLRDLLEVQDLETRLSTLMHRVPRLNPGNTASDAAALMFQYRARSMPVYRSGRFIGQITAAAIIQKLLESPSSTKISSIMTRNPVTLESSAKVAAARDIMKRRKIDQVPVIDGDKLVNVVTSSDLVFNLAPTPDRDQKGNLRRKRDEDSVGLFGRTPVVANKPGDSLGAVFDNMRDKSVNFSVVLGPEGVEGIVTYRDFMGLLTKRDAGPALPMYIIGIPEELFEASLVRRKFAETVELVRRVMPEVSEARAVIEAEGNNPAKKKNLVKIMVISPRRNYSYEVFSYDLGEAFDQVHSWAKRLVEQQKPSESVRRNSIRKRGRLPEFPEES